MEGIIFERKDLRTPSSWDANGCVVRERNWAGMTPEPPVNIAVNERVEESKIDRLVSLFLV